MKEKFGFCSLDFDADMHKYRNAKLETYTGPGYITITLTMATELRNR